MLNAVTIAPIPGIPLVQQGDDLPTLITAALTQAQITLQPGDALVVTSKIVSKAEGRTVDLQTVTPGSVAQRLAARTGKDPRMVELILRESTTVSRFGTGVLVTRHRLGFISANAGIDQSNLGADEHHALLLPKDPDASAALIRAALYTALGVEIGVIISDTHGRPFRMGNVGVAIGVAGMPALLDLRGQPDLFGRALKITLQGYADLVASAAHLVSGEGAEGLPVTLVRGLRFAPTDGHASDLNRPIEQDLYR
ncbi:MAG: coenzyme F420-0:L-glutamate ligase [Armatimonadetes bacterium]|nr:coenzyme F420-0:L-glutamate ligase [Anaerolineae bacterium]